MVRESPDARDLYGARLLWTLFGLTTTIIIIMLSAWAHSIDSRLTEIEKAHHGLIWHQQGHAARLDRLEADVRRLQRRAPADEPY